MRQYKNQYIFSSDIMRRHQRTRKRRRAALIILVIAAAAFFLTNFVISRRVVLDRVTITVLDLPADLEEYSILHISDLHGARYGDKQKAIATALGSIRYSCVVMTGDMLGDDQDVEPLLELIALMPEETPKYYVPGDTDGDYIDDRAHSSLSVYTEWAERLMAAGVQILDRPISETREKGTIWFVPEELYSRDLSMMEWNCRGQLNDLKAKAASLTADEAARMRVLEYQLERIADIKARQAEFQPGDIQVVVTHTPLSDEYVNRMISWTGKEDFFSMRYARVILAGHYNGGQWRIPFVGAVYVPELGWFPKDSEIRGLSYIEGIPQYISPGLGSDPHYTYQPGRLFNSPTITRITLTRYDP